MDSLGDSPQSNSISPAEMLPCLVCGSPIRYSLNRGAQLAFEASGMKVTYDRPEADVYRGIVGDVCETCAIRNATSSDRPGLVRDLRLLLAIQRRLGIPPTATFQRFQSLPNPEHASLSGFSMESVGCWVTPMELLPNSMRFDPSEGPACQFAFLFHVVRRERCYAELHWARDFPTGRHAITIDGAEKSSVADLKRLVEGMRFLKKIQASMGRPPEVAPLQEAEQWIDRYLDTLATGQRPLFSAFIDMSPYSERNWTRLTKMWGKTWSQFKREGIERRYSH